MNDRVPVSPRVPGVSGTPRDPVSHPLRGDTGEHAPKKSKSVSRPTWTEARNAVRCRACKAAPGDNCRSLLDRPLNACHPARMDDAAAILDYLEIP